MYKKYAGIDSRDTCCSSNNPNSIEAGISLENDEGTAILKFHFLDVVKTKNLKNKFIVERTKHMHLNEATRDELVDKLKSLEF